VKPKEPATFSRVTSNSYKKIDTKISIKNLEYDIELNMLSYPKLLTRRDLLFIL
jgi:hypothetical protein